MKQMGYFQRLLKFLHEWHEQLQRASVARENHGRHTQTLIDPDVSPPGQDTAGERRA